MDWKKFFRRRRKQLSPTEICVQLLDKILLTRHSFEYETAIKRLHQMKESGVIGIIDYMDLIDACNHRNEDGHYRNSRIYSRAVEQE